MDNKLVECCSFGSDCCLPQRPKKVIIDFLYLDLSVCGRCQGAEKNLEEALNEVTPVLEAAGLRVILNKINVKTKELAIKHQFVSSPTIRINGREIELIGKETLCQDCGSLCGESVDCRVWIYDGVEYTEPPKALIINAVFQEIYGEPKTKLDEKDEYQLPHNLEIFFEGLQNNC